MLFHAIFYWILDKINAWLTKPPELTKEEKAEARKNAKAQGYSDAEIDVLLKQFNDKQ